MSFFSATPITALSPPHTFTGINENWGGALGGQLFNPDGSFRGMTPYNYNDPAVQAAIAGLNANPSQQLMQARNAYSPYTQGTSYLDAYLQHRAGNPAQNVAQMGSDMQQYGAFGMPGQYMNNLVQYGAAGQGGRYAANMAQYGASSPGAGNFMANRAGGGQTASLGYLAPFMAMMQRAQYQAPAIPAQMRFRNAGAGFRGI